MPQFEPFHGLRYDPVRAPLAKVIAPPYDVVDDVERAELAARSPYNAIHVELPVASGNLDRYAHAAALLKSWNAEGALQRDERAFYLYRMSFTDERGEHRSTTGVIGALRIDASSAGEILPHERTMPKPKGDRLDLLRATGTNISPIWGLSLSEGLTTACERALQAVPSAGAAHDDEDILHELWLVTDPQVIGEISSLVAKTPIVVADGHHRYETAGFYREERRQENGDDDGPYDFVMALVVELSPAELAVQAIHRLASGFRAGIDLLGELEAFFVITPATRDPRGLLAEMYDNGALALVTKDRSFLLVPRPALEESSEQPLDSARLDVALASLAPSELVYQHGASNIIRAVDEGTADAGFLLRPATVDQIAATAHSGKRMPPKTTFFHPKPRTGIVYRLLEES